MEEIRWTQDQTSINLFSDVLSMNESVSAEVGLPPLRPSEEDLLFHSARKL